MSSFQIIQQDGSPLEKLFVLSTIFIIGIIKMKRLGMN